MRRRAVLVWLVVALAAAPACDDAVQTDPVCKDIPDGGCPMGRGDPCADPTCAAAYACTSSNAWRYDHACAASDAALDARSDAPAGDASDATTTGDAGARDVDVDVPGANGGPGCVELQTPDCPLGVASACGADCCGCEDLFVCQNGAWVAWGSCAGGVITPN